MKKLLTALSLGLGLTVMLLWGLVAGPTLVAQARNNLPEAQMDLDHNLPSLQAGTGVIRVATSGADVSGCGSAALPCATVQFAVDEANSGEEIRIAGGTYAGVQVRNGLTQTVYISKPLSLRGGYSTADGFATSNPIANPTTLNAQSNGRVILITGTVAAPLENLTITGGFVDGLNLCTGNDPSCGGGIFANGPLTLNNVNVLNNQSNRFGGGVAALTTTIINNSRFEDNAGLSGFSNGGGLYAEGPVTVNNSDFISNTADGGGGVYVAQASAQVINSAFERNAARNGGGLLISINANNAQTLEITNTTFVNNSATCQSFTGICNGGGVYAFDLPVTVVDSRFENNRVQDLFDNDDGNGGGLYLARSFNIATLTLVDTDFISNSTRLNGGGAYASNEAFVTGGRFERNYAGGNQTAFSDGGGGLRALSAVVNGTQFIQNSSDEDGAGLHVRLGADITDAQFQFNQTITNGGGIYAGFGALALTNTQFISNTAGMNGGGAYVFLGDAQVTGGRFDRNRANGPENDGAFLTFENGGGGLWVGNNVTLSGTEFSNNVAETNGGGAHVQGTAILNGGQFEQNQSLGNFVSSQGYGGGGLYAVNTLAFTDTIFSGNQAAFLGGGVWTSQDVSGLNGLFQNNAGGRGAGGLFTLNNLTLAGTQFINNEADLTGGGTLVGGAANLTNVLFQANRTISTSFATNGGGLAASEGFTATNTQFIDNTTTGRGAGASTFGPITLFNSLFQNNQSDVSGGGLASGFDPVVSRNTSFINNTAGADGGGVAASGNILLTDSLVQNNTAITNGGGLKTSSRVFITDTQIINNTAGENGGGIWANSGLNATNGRIENNNSGSSGGGFYGALGQINVNGTVFASNQAGSDGGGAYAFDGNAIGNALFEGNTATGAGGGLFLQRFVHITATQFLGNDANLGGGLAVSRTNSGTFVQFVHNSLFARNTATSSGAGIYWNQPRPINLIHNTLAGPGATSGAAIHIVTGTVNITNNIIANHTTGIEVVGGAVTEDYNLFSGNTANISGPVGGGANSFVGNPAFVDPANDDYHLTSDSLAINNALDAGILVDFEGEPRPGGGGFDIGFDETAFPPELQVNKTATPNIDVSYQGELTYTITLSNGSNFDATGVLLNDNLPGEVDFARWVEQPTGADVAADQITWNGTVSGTETVTFTFVVSHVGNYGDVFTNTADYFHPLSGLAGSASAQVSIAGPPLLSISKAVEPDTEVAYRGEVTYTVVISNDGPSDALGTLFTDTLPISTTFARWQTQPAGAGVLTDVVRWNGTVPAKETVTFSFVVSHTGDHADVVTNTAEYGHPTSSGTAAATFTVEPRIADLLISKISTRDQAAGLINYTIVVQNFGPDQADGLVVSDTIPTGISSFSWQCTPSGGATCTASGVGDINDTLTSFPALSQVVYEVTATLVSTDATIVNIAEMMLPSDLFNTAVSNTAIDTNAAVGDVFLPLVLKAPPPPAPPLAPDLIVENLIARSNAVTVTIKNIGDIPVVDGFWVDVYLNPDTVPTRVNQPWPDVGDQGLVWGIVAPSIGPGESVTLTLNDAAYRPDLSNFVTPLPVGSEVYAQVDSVNLLTDYGGVLESHEISGGAYNNIASTTSILGETQPTSSTAQPSRAPAPSDGLPPR